VSIDILLAVVGNLRSLQSVMLQRHEPLYSIYPSS
jgi:hypothetical protein